jgi:O-antigen/teichoic acid export membrane protein
VTDGPRAVSRDAAQLASGGGLVLAGSLLDKALRLFVGLFLARTFTVEDYGTYSYVLRTITIIAVAAPMGQDISMVFFGARFWRSNEKNKLKGSFLFGIGFTTLSAILLATATALVISRGWLGHQAHRPHMLTLAPVIVVMPVMLFLVSCLRGFKDMRGNMLAFQIVLPGSLLLGLLVVVGLLGGGISAALQVFIVSQALALLTAAALVWRHYGPLLRDRTLKASISVRRQLSYAVPQGLMGIVYRLNLWMDIMMLGWLASDREVGLFSVAASLALLGVLPAVSLNTMFNPMISELVQARELDRLNQLLQIVTRWLVLIVTPFFAVLLLVPDVALLLYGERYQEGTLVLTILLLGQFCIAIFAPTMRIIPMSGYSLLNLINGLGALALTLTLNYLLIPHYGGIGAALGTTITLLAWSAWRLAEVYHLFGCVPLSRRTLLVGGTTTATIALLFWLSAGSSVPVRLGIVAAFLPAYAAFAWRFGRDPEDHLISARLKKRLQRLLGRG